MSDKIPFVNGRIFETKQGRHFLKIVDPVNCPNLIVKYLFFFVRVYVCVWERGALVYRNSKFIEQIQIDENLNRREFFGFMRKHGTLLIANNEFNDMRVVLRSESVLSELGLTY